MHSKNIFSQFNKKSSDSDTFSVISNFLDFSLEVFFTGASSIIYSNIG